MRKYRVLSLLKDIDRLVDNYNVFNNMIIIFKCIEVYFILGILFKCFT